MRRARAAMVALVAAGLVAGAVNAAPPAHAVTQQFTWFDQTMTHDVNKYMEPAVSVPANWTSPVNWAGGRVFFRFEVTAKPSTKLAQAQICVWRNNFVEESCSATNNFTSTGVFWWDLGSPASWFKKNGTWSWATAFSPTRIMLKDAATGQLLMTGSCGASCYTGSDLTQHVPITAKASAIVVAPGATLAPPASWTGCPAAWSAACTTGPPGNVAPTVSAGPDTTILTTNPVTQLQGTVTDDGLPNPPATTTATWTKTSGPGTVTFGNANTANTSATFSAAGTYVLQLQGNDSALTNTDTVTIQVNDPNTPPPPGSQFTWFDQTLTHDFNQYMEPTSSAPANWTSPNYAGGRVFFRFEVTAKPSTKAALAQICGTRNNFSEETCSPLQPFNTTGVYWWDLGTPNSWWKLHNTWSWATAFSPTRIMLKDAATGQLLVSQACGTACYTGSDLTQHVPITAKVSAIVVASGSTLSPPASWAGCPTAWSAACTTGTPTNVGPGVNAGPDTTILTTNPVTQLQGTVTDDGLPNPPATTTATWTKTSGPGTVTFGNANTANTSATFSAAGTYVLQLQGNDSALTNTDTVTIQVNDPNTPPPPASIVMIAGNGGPTPNDLPMKNRLITLGNQVTVVDDDLLTPASVATADMVLITSSVVPTKIPAWMATLAKPVLSTEIYADTTLGIATSAVESASQTSLLIVGTGHPLAAGLTGQPAVTTAATHGSASPVAAATIIARSPVALNRAAIFGVETGAAITGGTAPARRVGYYLGYDAPPLQNSTGWKLFDAAVTWLLPAGPPPPPPPPPTGEPWNDAARHFRLPVTVAAGASARNDTAVERAVDFTTALTQAGGTGSFDPNSIRVMEVNSSGAVVDSDVLFQFDQATDYNATTAARGTLVLYLRGATAAGTQRRYQAYFDVVGAGVTPVAVTPIVTLSTVVDEGQNSYRIATANGTWYYHLQGGGFSSLVDSTGADWVSYSTATGSAGEYRGIPNAVYPTGHFHPGKTTSTTTLVSSGPLKISFRSTTTDGWQALWEVFPDRARMTMVAAPSTYWFLYEGTPGGQIDASDVVIRPGGVVTPLATAWTADLTDPEWVGFADTTRGRSLLLVQHTPGTETDSHWLMENNMTVFGFGRNGLNKYLTGQRQFSVALYDSAATANVVAAGTALANPIQPAIGTGEQKPAT